MINQNTNNYKSLHECLKDLISSRKEELQKLEECLKIVNNLKYKPGSVVVHKKYGNGLVLCPYQKELVEINSWTISYDKILDSFQENLGYVVQFVKMDQTSKTFDFIKEVVKEEDLLPYNAASSTLYGI